MPSLVPAQERVWSREGRHRFEAWVAKRVGEHREATAFRVRQAQPAARELGFQDTISLDEVGDYLLLVPLDPPGDHSDQDMKNHSRSSGWRP
jgi:hypothetical protein